jgi:cellulose synthase/poly-beta-1,6-N-acetylglucosamine synthase-like glycosyltransferase
VGTVLGDVVWWILMGSLAYLLVLYASASIAIGRNAIRGFRVRETMTDDPASLAVSRFTIPVSLLVPAHNEEGLVVAAVSSLLELNYPEYEVIVVSDGSTDGTIERLKAEFDLKPREVFYRRVLPTADVHRIYRSARDPRLIVVDKSRGGKGDALNCAVNLARYRYVCSVAADTVYNRDALLSTMPLAIRDPAHVLGVTADVAVRIHPSDQDGDRAIDRHLLSNFQQLERLSVVLSNRLVWTQLGFRLGSARAFGIWRRDAILDVRGFSTDRRSQEVDISFRIQEKYARDGQPGRVVALAEMVGTTEAPDSFGRLIRQRARWHRLTLETVARHREMLFNPRFGLAGLIGMPYYLLTMVVTPMMKLLCAVTAVLAVLIGVLDALDFLRLVGILAFGHGILVAASLALQESGTRAYRVSELSRLLLLGPFEVVLYRPAVLYASLKGTWGFLTGERSWDKLERNPTPRSA